MYLQPGVTIGFLHDSIGITKGNSFLINRLVCFSSSGASVDVGGL